MDERENRALLEGRSRDRLGTAVAFVTATQQIFTLSLSPRALRALKEYTKSNRWVRRL
jgi:hypothetical protein